LSPLNSVHINLSGDYTLGSRAKTWRRGISAVALSSGLIAGYDQGSTYNFAGGRRVCTGRSALALPLRENGLPFSLLVFDFALLLVAVLFLAIPIARSRIGLDELECAGEDKWKTMVAEMEKLRDAASHFFNYCKSQL